MKHPITIDASHPRYLYRVVDGTTIQRRRHSALGSQRWETITDLDGDPPDVVPQGPEAKRRRVSKPRA